eukprot:14315627-Alexandrium_andersonii.AAC.1
MWSTFTQYIEQHCVFSTPGLQQRTVVSCLHAVTSKLLPALSAQQTQTPHMLVGRFVFNVLKFVVPTDDDVEWCLKSNKECKDLLSSLVAPMQGPKFTPAKAAPTAAGEADAAQPAPEVQDA